MRFLAPALLLALAAPAAASGVKIALLEKGTGRATHFAFDTRTGALRMLDGVIGVEARRLLSYRVRDRRLVAGGKELGDADEILFQCRVGGADVLVVRTRERTLASAWTLLSSCGGRPGVEASAVSVLVVEGGAVARRQELARSEDPRGWTAVVLE